MNIQDWEIYRRIEMEQIKQEALQEIDAEIEASKQPMKTKDLFLLYAGAIIFVLIFFYFYANHPGLLYQVFEAPILKPIILACPGTYGVYMARKEKNKMNANIKRLKKKWANRQLD